MRLQHTWNNKAYDHVMERLRKEGFVAYAVGGCVRDAVLGFEPNDVDVATNARPHDLPKIFGTQPWDGDNAIRTTDDGVALYPTGVAHGTWTIRFKGDTVEVTTFRKDVDTDGRRATVEFADTPAVDAQRRDFTMNALYYNDLVGLVDPTGEGLSDLLAGRVRFVGDADERIKEDYLRIMRLFRFHARFGRGAMDRQAWEAAAKYRKGLSEGFSTLMTGLPMSPTYSERMGKPDAVTAPVSKERIWDELKKTLSVHSPTEAVWEMAATGVLKEVMGTNHVTETFARVLRNERMYNLKSDWTRRYTSLALDGHVPFPASNDEKKSTAKMADALNDWNDKPRGLAALSHEFGPDAATFVALAKDMPYNGSEVDRGAFKQMPLSASDLMAAGVEPGPAMGKLLAIAKRFWYDTDLRATKENLMVVALDELVHTDGS